MAERNTKIYYQIEIYVEWNAREMSLMDKFYKAIVKYDETY